MWLDLFLIDFYKFADVPKTSHCYCRLHAETWFPYTPVVLSLNKKYNDKQLSSAQNNAFNVAQVDNNFVAVKRHQVVTHTRHLKNIKKFNKRVNRIFNYAWNFLIVFFLFFSALETQLATFVIKTKKQKIFFCLAICKWFHLMLV